MAQEHTVSFRKPSHSRHERNPLKGDFRCLDGESLWTARGRASLEKHWFHFLELNYYVSLKLLIGCSSMSAPSGIILVSSLDVMFPHRLYDRVQQHLSFEPSGFFNVYKINLKNSE